MSERRFRRTPRGVCSLGPHLVWCPKYRWRTLGGRVAARCDELLAQVAAEHCWEIVAKEVMPDHMHLFVRVGPIDAPASVVRAVKGHTARILRQEFPYPQNRAKVLWSPQQATLRRLSKAFAGFFRRVKAGQTPGYPRFKGQARFDSVEWPKDGDGARWLPDAKRVYLRGIGQVKVHLHREVQGRVKTIQIKRQGRHWNMVLSCDDLPANPLPATGCQAGVDVGIVSFATTSDAEHIDNPRWACNAANKLATAQQRLARAKRGSKNRDRRREAVAARHRKIANQRKNFHHKTARGLVESYDLLVVEDLQITNMVRRAKPVPDPDNAGQYLANGARAKSGLSRSISDAGWGQFVSILRAKAEDAGRTLIEVDPGTPPTAAKPVGTQPGRTASPKRSSNASDVRIAPRLTNTPPATSYGLDWPATLKQREKKLAASAVREVTTLSCPQRAVEVYHRP